MTVRDAWRSPSVLQAALAVGLALIVAGSVLLIGSVHKPVLCVVGLGTAVCLIVAHRLTSLTRGGALHPASVVLLALAVWSLIQSIQLPLSWLREIAPASADIWHRALLPLGEERATGSISIDPGASRIEALRFAIYAGVFHVAVALARRRGGTVVVMIVFSVAAFVALTQLVHGLVGATKVFGLYAPKFTVQSRHLGPLLNGNNLAGYLNLGAIAGAGLLVSRRRSVSSWLLAVGLALIVAASLRAASRGGAIALPAGLVGLAIVQVFRRRSRLTRRDTLFAVAAVAAALTLGGALVVLAGVDDVLVELGSTNIQKVALQRASLDLVRDAPWTGIGRGAFETAFGPYRPPHVMHVVFTHPENFILQWLTEWGVPVTLAALGALAWAFLPRRRGAFRSVQSTACWFAVAALLLQNLADLGTEIPGIAIAAITLLATVGAAPRGSEVGMRQSHRRWGAPLVGAGLLATLASAADPDVLTIAVERERLRTVVTAIDAKDPAAVVAGTRSLRHAMARHPGDPYFPILGGTLALRSGDSPPMPWIQRALERGPLEGRAHLLLATHLEQRGARKQALLHLRRAIEHDPSLAQAAARSAARLVEDRADLEASVPSGAGGVRPLEQLHIALLDIERFELAALCDDLALERSPGFAKARARRVAGRIEALERRHAGVEPSSKDLRAAPMCAADDLAPCRAALEADLVLLEQTAPRSSVAAQLRARWFRAEGRVAEALSLLGEHCLRAEARAACFSLRFEMAAASGDAFATDAAQRDFVAEGCTRSDTCAQAWDRIATVRLDLGEVNSAISAASRAVKEEATEARWLRLAELAERGGAHAKALDALESLGRMKGGADQALEARLREARRRASGPR